MSRAKVSPEARAAAQEKANERAEASLKRQAAKASTWEGFAAFMAAYDHPPALSTSYEAMGVIFALGAWESARPSQRMRVAILIALQRFPAITLDPTAGRRLSAGEWLARLWPGPTPEELREMIDDSHGWFERTEAKKALDAAHGIEPGMAELLAMVKAVLVRASRYWRERDDPCIEEWPRQAPHAPMVHTTAHGKGRNGADPCLSGAEDGG
jgi:hypothetical protein